MWRSLIAVLSFAALCMTGSQSLLAQQAGAETGDSGLSVQGPQMISGEEMRAAREPGQLVGGQTQQVGALRSQAGAAPGQAGQQGRGGFGGSRQLNQLFNQFNNNFMNSMYDPRARLRFPVTLGFKPMIPMVQSQPAKTSKRLQDRLARIPRLRGNGPVTVEMDGPIAVIQGRVGSEDERTLVARVILLEPGISGVRNELKVATAAAMP